MSSVFPRSAPSQAARWSPEWEGGSGKGTPTGRVGLQGPRGRSLWEESWFSLLAKAKGREASGSSEPLRGLEREEPWAGARGGAAAQLIETSGV